MQTEDTHGSRRYLSLNAKKPTDARLSGPSNLNERIPISGASRRARRRAFVCGGAAMALGALVRGVSFFGFRLPLRHGVIF